MTDVTLPSLGESVTEGIITRWFKSVGDHVERDEPLFEVSTDKVDSEMPSPAAGRLVQIFAEEGETVETGARVAVIDEGDVGGGGPATVASEAPPSTAPVPVPTSVASSSPGVVLSPVVRRILVDGGLEPASVVGTGPGGSVTRRDAERAVAGRSDDEVAVPLSAGKRRMGRHMAASAQTTPHGFVAVEVEASFVNALEDVGHVTHDGLEITDEAVVGLAASRALGEFEFLNATLDGDELVVHHSVNLGVTRASDDGMLVPVVHAAGGLTLRALSRRLAELDERLTARHLTADDLMGATFTIARAPSPRTLISIPIVVPEQVAVLSMGAPRQVPVVAAGHVVTAWRMVLGLSFDHRVCEAVAASSYLERVAELLAGLDLKSER